MKILKKLKLGTLLFVLGFIGVLTILTMEIPIPEDFKNKINKLFTPFQFKLLSLINPTFMLLILVTIGTLIYDKIGFKLPIFERIAFGEKKKINWKSILKFGLTGGVLSGLILTFVSHFFNDFIPKELQEFSPNALNRFFYGGITEEIFMRFGLMTFIIWILSLITKNRNPWIYWIGIIVSSLLFGIGHLPIVNSFVENPTAQLIAYVIIGNSLGGVIFGWIYWKKGLESAMIAHIFTHLIFIIISYI